MTQPPIDLGDRRLQKLMGPAYENEPLRRILGKLDNVRSVEDMDGGSSVEWADLASERERKIAAIYFNRGVRFLEEELKRQRPE